MDPRYYQTDAVQAVYEHLRTKTTNPCAVLPTASGKSVCLAMIAADTVKAWGGRCLIVAGTKELLEQNAAKVKAIAPELDIGVCSAGLDRFEPSKSVVVGGIQTIYNKPYRIGHIDICIIDECHLIPPDGDGMYRSLIAGLHAINPKMRVVGFTATDFRLGSGRICRPENILNEVCYEIGIRELMDKGFISKVCAKSGKFLPDIDGLHIRGGEFVTEDVEAAVNRGDLLAGQCREIVSYTKPRQACLVFCSSVAHAEAAAKLIAKFSGEECPVVTGETPSEVRAEIIARLRGEEIPIDLFGAKKPPLKYCANVSVLTTGTDIPRLDTIAILRVTASPGLFLQIIGRGFRLSPGKKECLLLDYGRHIERFGPIDMIKGKEPRGGGRHEALAKTCPSCNTILPLPVMRCPECGYEYPPPEHREKTEGSASTLALFSGEVTTETLEVTEVSYEPWTKRGSPPGYPRTVRVTYTCGLGEDYSEWICPEHTGYARRKFEAWFKDRRVNSDAMIPESVDEFMEHVFAGMIRGTKEITIRRVAGERFPEVVKSTPCDHSPDDEPVEEEIADEDLPF